MVDGGQVALIGSEGSRSPVLRLELAAMGMASGGSASTPRSTGTGSPPPEAAPDAAGDRGTTGTDDDDSLLPLGRGGNTWLVIGAGGAALVLLLAGTITLLSRRH